MPQAQLRREIIDRSEAAEWEAARKEWGLAEIYFAEEPETCLCGHHPIIELCVLRNHRNMQLATVGNCCVKRFIGLPSDAVFRGIKNIRSDVTKSMNDAAITFAAENGWINDWETGFYRDVWRKRVLSDKQMKHKVRINKKVLSRLRTSGTGTRT